ncbi:unnamed protein product, partial [marine sediment metagenome]
MSGKGKQNEEQVDKMLKTIELLENATSAWHSLLTTTCIDSTWLTDNVHSYFDAKNNLMDGVSKWAVTTARGSISNLGEPRWLENKIKFIQQAEDKENDEAKQKPKSKSDIRPMQLKTMFEKVMPGLDTTENYAQLKNILSSGKESKIIAPKLFNSEYHDINDGRLFFDQYYSKHGLTHFTNRKASLDNTYYHKFPVVVTTETSFDSKKVRLIMAVDSVKLYGDDAKTTQMFKNFKTQKSSLEDLKKTVANFKSQVHDFSRKG